MLQAIKGLAGSRKFWTTVIGSGVCAAVGAGLSIMKAPTEVTASIVGAIGALFGINIGAQGYVDSKIPKVQK